MAKSAAAEKRPPAVVLLEVPKPVKHSVRFAAKKKDEGGPVDPIIRDVYVDRLAAMKAFGVEDLDTVKAVRVTLELVA